MLDLKLPFLLPLLVLAVANLFLMFQLPRIINTHRKMIVPSLVISIIIEAVLLYLILFVMIFGFNR